MLFFCANTPLRLHNFIWCRMSVEYAHVLNACDLWCANNRCSEQQGLNLHWLHVTKHWVRTCRLPSAELRDDVEQTTGAKLIERKHLQAFNIFMLLHVRVTLLPHNLGSRLRQISLPQPYPSSQAGQTLCVFYRIQFGHNTWCWRWFRWEMRPLAAAWTWNILLLESFLGL